MLGVNGQEGETPQERVDALDFRSFSIREIEAKESGLTQPN